MTRVIHEGATSGHSSQCDQGDDPDPSHPGARLPRDTSTGIREWPMDYPLYTSMRYGRISSVSATHDATKFARPHKSHMRQYIIKSLFNRAQPMRALINIGGGYHLGASNL
jgi:hypothetical protein